MKLRNIIWAIALLLIGAGGMWALKEYREDRHEKAESVAEKDCSAMTSQGGEEKEDAEKSEGKKGEDEHEGEDAKSGKGETDHEGEEGGCDVAREKTDSVAMAAEAKVSEAAARTSALTLVPGGTVTSGKLKRDDAALIWKFEITIAGQPGIEEVHVDAVTGKLLGRMHEAEEERDTKAVAPTVAPAAKKGA